MEEEPGFRIVRVLPDRVAGIADLPWPEMPAWKGTSWETYKAPVGTEARSAAVFAAVDPSGAFAGWIAGTQLHETAELEFVVVRRDCRGRGWGCALLRRWMQWAAAEGATEAYLEVRAGNEAALRLYLAQGFVAAGRRRAYYKKPTEDALILRRTLAARGL